MGIFLRALCGSVADLFFGAPAAALLVGGSASTDNACEPEKPCLPQPTIALETPTT
jgi:hypothetical protein